MQSKLGWRAKSPDDLPIIAENILIQAGVRRLFVFHGGLGAGKTSLIKCLLKELKVNEAGSSPTYSIVNEYMSSDYGKVFHLDLYRLNTVEELYDIGIEEILDDHSFIFVEWPELLKDLIDQDYVEIQITLEKDYRIIEMRIAG